MRNVLAVFSICLILCTGIPLLGSPWWYIRVFDFPQLQLYLLLLVAIITNLVVFRREVIFDYVLLGSLLISFGYTSFLIYPYTPLAKPRTLSAAPEQAGSISILTANVYMDNHEVAPIKNLIDKLNPDIVLLLETNQWWIDNLGGIDDEFEYSVEVPLQNTYGMAIYSKLPLSNTQVKYLIEDEIPSIHTEVNLREGTTVKLHCLHPKPPTPMQKKTSTPRDAELMLVAKSTGFNDRPTIVAGDLNDVAWSHTTRLFQRVSGLLDPRIGRGVFNTYHTKYPFIRWPLDHVFHSNDFLLTDIRRLEDIGSDHFPIYVELLYKAGTERMQPEPKPKNDDMEETDDVISKGKKEE